MQSTILWQRAEGAILFVAAIWLFAAWPSPLTWWMAIPLFLTPDLSFLAYLAGPRIGAAAYNLVHVYAFGAALLAIGLVAGLPLLAALGALWLAHSGLDRALGYGLKSPDSFSLTHLGPIGKGRR